jgi:hypothetical protein
VGQTLFVTRAAYWYSERPQRPPAECACLLAGDRFWRDERLSLLGTHPDFPDVAEASFMVAAQRASASAR